MCDRWRRRFVISRPLPGLPWPRVAAVDSVGASYRLVGSARRRDAAAVVQMTLAGHGRFMRGRESWDLPPGSGFLCRVGDPAIAYAHAGGDEPWCFAFVSFVGAHAAVDAICAREGPIVHAGARHPVLRLLRDLRHLGEHLRAGEAAVLVQRVLAAVIDGAAAGTGSGRADVDLVQRARQTVATNLAAVTTVSVLAQMLGVSREHLTRAVQRELGVGAKTWLAAERLEAVRERLMTSPAAVAEIAADLGYASVSRLCRNFRVAYGDTPERYRRHRGLR